MISAPRFVAYGEVEKVVQLLDLAFEKTPAEYFRRKLVEPDTRTVAIFDGDVPVSTLTLYDRQVWYGGSRLRMLGIGDVGTHPDYRGRGLASKLMKFAVDFMKEQGYQLSILFTDINSYYERFGYVTVEKLFTLVPIDRRAESGFIRFEDAEAVRPYLSDMLRLYNEMASKCDYSIFRDEELFLKELRWFFADGGKGLAVGVDGKLTAYGFFRVREGDAVFFDFAGDAERLIAGIGRAEKAIFPADPSVVGVADDVETFTDTGMMVLWADKSMRREHERPFFALLDGF